MVDTVGHYATRLRLKKGLRVMDTIHAEAILKALAEWFKGAYSIEADSQILDGRTIHEHILAALMGEK